MNERIAAPPDRVLTHFADINRWSEWMPNLVSVEQLTPGSFGKGTQWRETRKMFGREATEHFEVTAFDPPRSLELLVDGSKGASGRGLYRFRYTFTGVGPDTLMSLEGEISGMGWFFETLGKLFAGPFKKAIAKDSAAFKAYAERQQRQSH